MKNLLQPTFCLLMALLFLSPNAFSQKSKRQQKREARKERQANHIKYSTRQYGLAYSTFQDLGLSNQIYSGPGVNILFGDFKETPTSLREFNFLGGANSVSSQVGTTGFDFTLNWNYAYLFLLKQEEDAKWRVAVGPKGDILGQFRLISALGNSSFHWDGIGSVGVAARADRDWVIPFIKKEINFYSKAHLPVLAYVNRPIYGVTTLDFPNQTVTTLGRFFRLETEVGATFPVRKGNPNLFSVAYRWDMYRFRDSEIHRVITGHHGLHVGLWVRMK